MSIVVAERPQGLPTYDRDDWKHWTDVDGDCQDTRQEVLIAESSVPVTFRDEGSCRVATGRWTGPYTDEVVDDPGKLDVDHVVPLANAHLSGAHGWSSERKELFANSLSYPGHLVAATAAANRSKGRKGPDEWRPPDRTYWCRYAMDWVAIKTEWGLTATGAEAAALREMLAGCQPSVHLQVLTAGISPPASTPRAPSPAPATPAATQVPVQTGLKYDPDGPDPRLRRLRDMGRGAGLLQGCRRAGGRSAQAGQRRGRHCVRLASRRSRPGNALDGTHTHSHPFADSYALGYPNIHAHSEADCDIDAWTGQSDTGPGSHTHTFAAVSAKSHAHARADFDADTHGHSDS